MGHINNNMGDTLVLQGCYKDKITMDEGKSHSQEKKTFENSYVC